MKLLNLQRMDNTEIYFDLENSYWPVSLKADDPFNDKFKITIVVGNIGEKKDIIFAVKYRGEHYGLHIIEDVGPDSVITITWKDKPPTIKEFIESLGGQITETTTIDLTWETGYLVSENEFILTDAVDTQIYVEVEEGWQKYLPYIMAAGIGLVVVGAVVASKKEKFD